MKHTWIKELGDRMRQGWSWVRAIYLVLGLGVAIRAWMQQEWVGVFLGIVFGLMGLFGWRCAAASCRSDHCSTKKQTPEHKEKEIAFEEIK
ncbi:MAG: hypothetical protein NZL95_05440 [Chitinophagales bacterium]|nr:hypothetical protein [Chitinophagales bacterium]MDW8427977.1 hypothetical protein [Chitinophagales bacterium]